MADSNYRKTFLEIKENETVWIDARVAQATTQLTKDQKKYQTFWFFCGKNLVFYR